MKLTGRNKEVTVRWGSNVLKFKTEKQTNNKKHKNKKATTTTTDNNNNDQKQKQKIRKLYLILHPDRKDQLLNNGFHLHGHTFLFKHSDNIPIISSGLTFVQKAVLLGLFSGELIFGGANYWKEFYILKWVGLPNKYILKQYGDSLKQLTLTVHGLIFGRAYYWREFCV